MKLTWIKITSELLTAIGVVGMLIFLFSGKALYGWFLLIVMLLLSGSMNYLFFRCPSCKAPIQGPAMFNQKYCPECGKELGIMISPISYYSKCSYNKKKNMYKGYTVIGQMTAILTVIIFLLVVFTVLGFEGMTGKVGRILVVAALFIGVLLGFICRCIAGSAVALDDEKLYYCKMPLRWKSFDLQDIKDNAKKMKPFYHSVRGFVFATKDGLMSIPIASYKGGDEFLRLLTEKIDIPMIDIDPNKVATKYSDEGRIAEEKYIKLANKIKKEEETKCL